MRPLTFPRDTTWQKSTCLTPSLTSSTTTSTMQQVREADAEQRSCWFARWLFWMKEGSQALCPYNEVLNGITFSHHLFWNDHFRPSSSFQHYILTLVVLLRLTMANTDVIMTCNRVYHHCQGKLSAGITLQGLLEVICPWVLIWQKSRTWPASITRRGDSHPHCPGVPRETLGFTNTL